MTRVAVMILAGGRGKRMDILCYGRPKPVLPFGGKLRVIDFSLSNCLHSGIERVAVLVDYQRNHLSDYLQGWRQTNSQGAKLRILEPRHGSYLGTADAVYQNLDYLDENKSQVVLVLAGDHVYRMDYRKMLAYHHEVKADVTIGVIPVPIDQAHRFGIVTTDSDGRIVDFAEKPGLPTGNLASMGIYVFNRRVLAEHLVEDSREQASPHDFGYALIPKMIGRHKVFAYKYEDYWQDIGTVEAYYEANMELVRQMPTLGLNGRWPIFSKDNSFLPPKIASNGHIQHSIISPGCVIKGKVENSILSPRVIVEEGAVVRNSVVMDGARIGVHSVVDRCIIDEYASVGEFCFMGFGTSSIPGDWDITVVGRSSKVPAGTAIGRSCKILPDVDGKSFVGGPIPSGTIVS